jgi:hypothetical protein
MTKDMSVDLGWEGIVQEKILDLLDEHLVTG